MLDNFADDALTTVSLSGKPPKASDRRRSERHVTVLRVAKLFTAEAEEFCLVRNISSGGLMAHIYSDLQPEDGLTVEFKSGWVITGHVVWRQEDLAGVQFDQQIDCRAVLSGSDFMPMPYRARAPRVNLEVRARIRVGSRYRLVTIRNISQGGANIEPAEPEDMDSTVVLMIHELPTITGMIRWQKEGRAGVSFDSPVALDALAQWVTSAQRRNRKALSFVTGSGLPEVDGDASGAGTPLLPPSVIPRGPPPTLS